MQCLGGYPLKEKKKSPSRKDKKSSSLQAIYDYHGYRLYEAQNKICDDIIEAYEMGCREAQLIHGYKQGQAIRSYIWGNPGLRKHVQKMRQGIRFTLQQSGTKAITSVLFHQQ
jgi:DNA-nicking Smr family endonuclease